MANLKPLSFDAIISKFAKDASDSFLPDTTRDLSLYGKRLHLTLYYQQKKQAYIYFLLALLTGGIGGHLFYLDRIKDGYKRLLFPAYTGFALIAAIVLQSIFYKLISWIPGSEWLLMFTTFITTIIGIIMLIYWIVLVVIDVYKTSSNIMQANINLSKELTLRLQEVDDKKP